MTSATDLTTTEQSSCNDSCINTTFLLQDVLLILQNGTLLLEEHALTAENDTQLLQTIVFGVQNDTLMLQDTLIGKENCSAVQVVAFQMFRELLKLQGDLIGLENDLKELFKRLKDIIERIIQIGKAILALINKICEFISKLIELKNKVLELLRKIGQLPITLTKDILNQIKGFADKIINYIPDKVKELRDEIIPPIKQGFDWFKRRMHDLLDEIGSIQISMGEAEATISQIA